MASATAARSVTGSCSQTFRLAMCRMFGPPGVAHSLKGRHQLCNGSCRQDRTWRTRCPGEIRAGNRDVCELIGKDLNLAVPNVARKVGKTGQLQNPTKERMRGIGDGDSAFADFSD